MEHLHSFPLKSLQDRGLSFNVHPEGGARLALPCGAIRDCTRSTEVPYLVAHTRSKKGIRKRRLPGTAPAAAESGSKIPPSASSNMTEASGASAASTARAEASGRSSSSKDPMPPTSGDAVTPLPPPPHPESDVRKGKNKKSDKNLFRKKTKAKPFGRTTPSNSHNPYVHFPKDPKCEVCQKVRATKANKNRRNGEVYPGGLPKPEEFGDLITADHF